MRRSQIDFLDLQLTSGTHASDLPPDVISILFQLANATQVPSGIVHWIPFLKVVA